MCSPGIKMDEKWLFNTNLTHPLAPILLDPDVAWHLLQNTRLCCLYVPDEIKKKKKKMNYL